MTKIIANIGTRKTENDTYHLVWAEQVDFLKTVVAGPLIVTTNLDSVMAVT